MKIKICGMKYPENIKQVGTLKPDMMGFIFYEKSPRYVNASTVKFATRDLDPEIQKVGVFVKSSIENVIETVRSCKLDFVQLHGGEEVSYCQSIREAGIKVVKVFHGGPGFNLKEVEPFLQITDYFLFDTKTKNYGGSGRHFDWSVLEGYTYDVPFLLSGGLKPSDLSAIKAIDIPQLTGIDANSKLELEPGLKDIEKVKALMNANKA
ncbi:MAG: phosphoribosylanthranilate isomerase [Bacteroidota bacterium]